MEPQRKRGICLAESPAVGRPENHHSSFRDRAVSSGAQQQQRAERERAFATGSLPRRQQSARSGRELDARELVTFKGRGDANSNTGAAGMPPPEASATAAQPAQVAWRQKPGGDIFQVIPLEDHTPTPGGVGSSSASRGRSPTPMPPGALVPVHPYKQPAEAATAASNDRGRNLVAPFRFAGFIGTIGSALMFSLGVFCVKLMPVEDEMAEKAKIVMFRGVSLMISCGLAILLQGSTFLIRRDEIPLNIIRSVVGFFGSFGIYVAIQFITIAEASALAYSSPLWTCILGYFILRERLPITLVAAFPLGALALILIAHPDLLLNVQDEVLTELERHHLRQQQHVAGAINHSATTTTTTSDAQLQQIRSFQEAFKHHLNDSAIFEMQLEPQAETELYLEQRWPGVLVAILTSLVIAVVNICLKFRKTTPINTTTFYLGLANFLLALLFQCFIGFGSWPSTWLEWTLHLAIGVCSFMGQYLFQWSLMYESAGTLSVVRTSDIVFSFVWSAVFLHEDVLWTSVLGAALIALVVALIMFNGQIQSRLAACCCGGGGRGSKS